MDPLKLSAPQETKLHFLDYWRIIRIRKTVILAVFLLVVITATIVTFILPESYSAMARIKVDRDVTDVDPVGNRTFTPGAYDPYFIQTEFEVIQSEIILSNVVQTLNLNQEWGNKYAGGERLKTTETMALLKKQMDLRPVRNTSFIEIRVYSDNPEEAARLANVIAETYSEHRKRQVRDLMSSGLEALKKEWNDYDTNLGTAYADLDVLRTTLKISDPDPFSTAPTPIMSADTLRQLKSQVIPMESDLVRIETQLAHLENLTAAQRRETIQTAADSADGELGGLLSDLNNAEKNLLGIQKDYGTSHPEYVMMQKAITNLNEKINRRIEGIMLGLKNRVEAKKAAIEKLNEKIADAKEEDLQLAEKSRPYYRAKQRLDQTIQFRTILANRFQTLQADSILPKTMMVTITDRAVRNDHAVRPNKPLNIALGIVIGLVVGVGLAFFIEYLDTSVKTIDDVERTLQSPVLGVIPQNVGFLLDEGAESPHAEAYRVLRTNLLFSRKEDKLNTVAVVSAGAGEGKSTTVFNLATVFAQNGNRVVIVDSDLRRPTLHKMLRVTNNIGLTNYLLKQNRLEEVIQTTSEPRLDFLSSGKLPSSSMGILSSGQMRDLISELKQRYDFVFFDSPPIMGVSDASVLASEVDMTLQVIQYRRYPQPMNIRAKQMIEKVGGNLIGIVLNNINVAQDESYYYYSGYYHEYYSKNADQDVPATAEAAAGGPAESEIKPKY